MAPSLVAMGRVPSFSYAFTRLRLSCRAEAASRTRGGRLRAQMPTIRDVVLLGLLAYAGLRPGEAIALTWGSVGRVLVIDRSYSDAELKLTKTNRRRTVEVVAPLADNLALHRSVGAGADDLVCPSEVGGPLDLSNWRTRVWDLGRERAGVRAVPYDGRHTFASLLIHEGRPLPYVTAAMGHASAVTTLNHCAHVFDEARLAPAESMVGAIRAARAQIEAERLRETCAEPAVGGSSTLRADRSDQLVFQRLSRKRETGLEPATLSLEGSPGAASEST